MRHDEERGLGDEPERITTDDASNDHALADRKPTDHTLNDHWSCPSCGHDRPNRARCTRCGDHLSDTSGLSPYERLGLSPRPIYPELEVRRAERSLLNEFHVLKTPRHLSYWTLKQRALIARDASTLRSMSGALGAHLKLYISRAQLLPDVDSLWSARPSALAERLERAVETQETREETPRGVSARDHHPDSLAHNAALERALLDQSYAELREYDGYQERSKLIIESARRLRHTAGRVARELDALMSDDLEPNQQRSQVARLMREIGAVEQLERWLEARCHVRAIFK